MNIHGRDRLSCAVTNLSVLTEKCMISSVDPGQTIACCRQIILKWTLLHGFIETVLDYFRI